MIPDESNIKGCDHLEPPVGLAGQKYMWLVERGDCTYSKKAYVS